MPAAESPFARQNNYLCAAHIVKVTCEVKVKNDMIKTCNRHFGSCVSLELSPILFEIYFGIVVGDWVLLFKVSTINDICFAFLVKNKRKFLVCLEINILLVHTCSAGSGNFVGTLTHQSEIDVR